jgi:hypothetical protein
MPAAGVLHFVNGTSIFAKDSRAEIAGVTVRRFNIRGSNFPKCEFRHSPLPCP